MKNKILLALAAAVLVFTGCTTVQKTIPGVGLPLADAEYEILGEVHGVGEIQEVFGFYALHEDFGSIGGIKHFGFATSLGVAKEMALFDAITKMPDADFIIYPKYIVTKSGCLGFYHYEVKVIAQGIKLKDGPVTKAPYAR